MQNQVDYGLTAGLHSLDPDELALWLAEVEAGNLYVNRGITGAVVRRQPFGGWKRSVVGASTKAGGPNYLVHLGSWTSTKSTAKAKVSKAVTPIVAAASSDFVERSARSDQAAWEREFGVAKDVSALGVERNVFRYRSLPVLVRMNAGGSVDELARVVAAGVRAGGLLGNGDAASHSEGGRNVSVSVAEVLPAGLARAITATGVSVVVESDEEWLSRARDTKLETSRVRLLGGGHQKLSEALGGSPDVAIYSDAATEAGRVELLPFLREQAIAITAHRFGTPDHWSDPVLPL